jgi:transposase InsO family protein
LDLGHDHIPSASTITEILRRHGLLDETQATKHRPFVRFEHGAPNDLWQMDFKGHFALDTGGRCHPLTVLDDHSRFALGLRACADERTATVRDHLVSLFERHGLPRRILCDNGPPWGDGPEHPHTPLGVWLIRLGVGVCHGRPYHPQTQGKDERFHRTLLAEAVRGHRLRDLPHCQRHFDAWREIYNHERPHEALSLAVPASRYAPSGREYIGTLAPIEYGPGDTVRRVQQGGRVHFGGRVFRVPKAFWGQPVAIRPTDADGCFSVHFCQERIGQIDLRRGPGSPGPRLGRP